MNLIEQRSIPEPNSGCWIWTAGASGTGYGTIKFEGRVQAAHRVSWQVHCGPIPTGLNVCHRCDTPFCVNPDHLFLGTQAENIHDMDRKGRGRRPRGEQNTRARLSEADVQTIRSSSLGIRRLARQFGVVKETIRLARTGETWAHVSRPQAEAGE